MSLEEARRAAYRKLGNPTLVREEIYRMALGADSVTVIRMIMRESAILVAIGIVAGAALAVYGARQASTLLFGLQPGDPSTLALSIAGLAAVAAMASYLPAQRAARMDPTAALREE